MTDKKYLSPIKTIRSHCLWCSSGQPKEVRNCPITDCNLYPFRLGKNPNRKGIGQGMGLSKKKLQLSQPISPENAIQKASGMGIDENR